jgi:hypothetical protein
MSPTDTRLKVLQQVSEQTDWSLFESVLLTGSMVFGKYHSVNDESDIDLICVIDPAKISRLRDNSLFNKVQINPDLLEAFATGRIDRFWLDCVVDGISLNIGVWDNNFLADFCNLNADVHRLGSLNSNIKQTTVLGLDGTEHAYNPTVEMYKSIFIKNYPLKVGELHLTSPTYCNLIASEVLYDPKDLWPARLRSLIDKLNGTYGSSWTKPTLDYVMQKSSESYLSYLRNKL